ncbi:hypothetical protein LCGC14_2905790, partial [marine sediment metagenome]
SIWGHNPEDYVKPSVAVMKFENRAGGPRGWNVGDGMKDVLVDRLMATRRFHVIERPELDSVMAELRLQNSGVTRSQRRSALGRLKNVQYLVKGTITDFGHVSTRSSFFAGGGWNIFGGGTRAVMGLTMYVVDVESGEIICSKSIEESVKAKDLSAKATYRGVAFGGTVFYRTPLGKATRKVIGKAVKQICRSIAGMPWEPKIALVQPDGTVIINGGKDRKVRPGAEYIVYEVGDPIVDPDTGDTIGTQPGPQRGRLRVIKVHPRYSVAAILTGQRSELRIGQHCRPAPAVAAK